MSMLAAGSGRAHAQQAMRGRRPTMHGSRLTTVRASASAPSSAEPARPRPDYVPNRISDPNYIRIFDTTLRDGEQAPGASLTSKQKLGIARQLARLGVDVIEAGFPVASPDDFEAVKLIAQEVGNAETESGHVPVICGMARAKAGDLERAWDAVRHARRPRVHTLIATSDIHMKYKLKMSRDQVIDSAVGAISHLKSLGCHDIEFTAEDASRSDPEFLCLVLAEAIKAGATTLMIPDTVGYSMTHEYWDLFNMIRQNTPGIENVVLSAHCHDDLGCSTANSIAGALAGARQIECTMNGIGERAGNASLEEIVMALQLKGDQMGGLWTGIRPVHLYQASQMVSKYSGMVIQPNKAIVGANAFSHESGMHQDGMLKHRETYQIMTPEAIGLQPKGEESRAGIVLGKHSGRHALSSHMKGLGFELTQEELDDLFKRFKALADSKKVISDDDLLALAGDDAATRGSVGGWDLLDLQVVRGKDGTRTCLVTMQGPDGNTVSEVGQGNGPVAAAYKAIESLVGATPTLLEYSVQSVTEGIDALVTTHVTIRPPAAPCEVDDSEECDAGHWLGASGRGRVFAGQGTDVDIVVSSARAYVAGINKMVAWQRAQQAAIDAKDAAGGAAAAGGGAPLAAEPEGATAAAGGESGERPPTRGRLVGV
ncbi:MAG: 2-isopropylmalate synthase [Monoraphidium minutum]|nr:MAG: 2-isopropylmalate synthase [Monoraphidium minutum]